MDVRSISQSRAYHSEASESLGGRLERLSCCYAQSDEFGRDVQAGSLRFLVDGEVPPALSRKLLKESADWRESSVGFDEFAGNTLCRIHLGQQQELICRAGGPTASDLLIEHIEHPSLDARDHDLTITEHVRLVIGTPIRQVTVLCLHAGSASRDHAVVVTPDRTNEPAECDDEDASSLPGNVQDYIGDLESDDGFSRHKKTKSKGLVPGAPTGTGMGVQQSQENPADNTSGANATSVHLLFIRTHSAVIAMQLDLHPQRVPAHNLPTTTSSDGPCCCQIPSYRSLTVRLTLLRKVVFAPGCMPLHVDAVSLGNPSTIRCLSTSPGVIQVVASALIVTHDSSVFRWRQCFSSSPYNPPANFPAVLTPCTIGASFDSLSERSCVVLRCTASLEIDEHKECVHGCGLDRLFEGIAVDPFGVGAGAISDNAGGSEDRKHRSRAFERPDVTRSLPRISRTLDGIGCGGGPHLGGITSQRRWWTVRHSPASPADEVLVAHSTGLFVVRTRAQAVNRANGGGRSEVLSVRRVFSISACLPLPGAYIERHAASGMGASTLEGRERIHAMHLPLTDGTAHEIRLPGCASAGADTEFVCAQIEATLRPYALLSTPSRMLLIDLAASMGPPLVAVENLFTRHPPTLFSCLALAQSEVVVSSPNSSCDPASSASSSSSSAPTLPCNRLRAQSPFELVVTATSPVECRSACFVINLPVALAADYSPATTAVEYDASETGPQVPIWLGSPSTLVVPVSKRYCCARVCATSERLPFASDLAATTYTPDCTATVPRVSLPPRLLGSQPASLHLGTRLHASALLPLPISRLGNPYVVGVLAVAVLLHVTRNDALVAQPVGLSPNVSGGALVYCPSVHPMRQSSDDARFMSTTATRHSLASGTAKMVASQASAFDDENGIALDYDSSAGLWLVADSLALIRALHHIRVRLAPDCLRNRDHVLSELFTGTIEFFNDASAAANDAPGDDFKVIIAKPPRAISDEDATAASEALLPAMAVPAALLRTKIPLLQDIAAIRAQVQKVRNGGGEETTAPSGLDDASDSDDRGVANEGKNLSSKSKGGSNHTQRIFKNLTRLLGDVGGDDDEANMAALGIASQALCLDSAEPDSEEDAADYGILSVDSSDEEEETNHCVFNGPSMHASFEHTAVDSMIPDKAFQFGYAAWLLDKKSELLSSLERATSYLVPSAAKVKPSHLDGTSRLCSGAVDAAVYADTAQAELQCWFASPSPAQPSFECKGTYAAAAASGDLSALSSSHKKQPLQTGMLRHGAMSGMPTWWPHVSLLGPAAASLAALRGVTSSFESDGDIIATAVMPRRQRQLDTGGSVTQWLAPSRLLSSDKLIDFAYRLNNMSASSHASFGAEGHASAWQKRRRSQFTLLRHNTVWSPQLELLRCFAPAQRGIPPQSDCSSASSSSATARVYSCGTSIAAALQHDVDMFGGSFNLPAADALALVSAACTADLSSAAEASCSVSFARSSVDHGLAFARQLLPLPFVYGRRLPEALALLQQQPHTLRSLAISLRLVAGWTDQLDEQRLALALALHPHVTETRLLGRGGDEPVSQQPLELDASRKSVPPVSNDDSAAAAARIEPELAWPVLTHGKEAAASHQPPLALHHQPPGVEAGAEQDDSAHAAHPPDAAAAGYLAGWLHVLRRDLRGAVPVRAFPSATCAWLGVRSVRAVASPSPSASHRRPKRQQRLQRSGSETSGSAGRRFSRSASGLVSSDTENSSSSSSSSSSNNNSSDADDSDTSGFDATGTPVRSRPPSELAPLFRKTVGSLFEASLPAHLMLRPPADDNGSYRAGGITGVARSHRSREQQRQALAHKQKQRVVVLGVFDSQWRAAVAVAQAYDWGSAARATSAASAAASMSAGEEEEEDATPSALADSAMRVKNSSSRPEQLGRRWMLSDTDLSCGDLAPLARVQVTLPDAPTVAAAAVATDTLPHAGWRFPVRTDALGSTTWSFATVPPSAQAGSAGSSGSAQSTVASPVASSIPSELAAAAFQRAVACVTMYATADLRACVPPAFRAARKGTALGLSGVSPVVSVPCSGETSGLWASLGTLSARFIPPPIVRVPRALQQGQGRGPEKRRQDGACSDDDDDSSDADSEPPPPPSAASAKSQRRTPGGSKRGIRQTPSAGSKRRGEVFAGYSAIVTTRIDSDGVAAAAALEAARLEAQHGGLGAGSPAIAVSSFASLAATVDGGRSSVSMGSASRRSAGKGAARGNAGLGRQRAASAVATNGGLRTLSGLLLAPLGTPARRGRGHPRSRSEGPSGGGPSSSSAPRRRALSQFRTVRLGLYASPLEAVAVAQMYAALPPALRVHLERQAPLLLAPAHPAAATTSAASASVEGDNDAPGSSSAPTSAAARAPHCVRAAAAVLLYRVAARVEALLGPLGRLEPLSQTYPHGPPPQPAASQAGEEAASLSAAAAATASAAVLLSSSSSSVGSKRRRDSEQQLGMAAGRSKSGSSSPFQASAPKRVASAAAGGNYSGGLVGCRCRCALLLSVGGSLLPCSSLDCAFPWSVVYAATTMPQQQLLEQPGLAVRRGKKKSSRAVAAAPSILPSAAAAATPMGIPALMGVVMHHPPPCLPSAAEGAAEPALAAGRGRPRGRGRDAAAASSPAAAETAATAVPSAAVTAFFTGYSADEGSLTAVAGTSAALSPARSRAVTRSASAAAAAQRRLASAACIEHRSPQASAAESQSICPMQGPLEAPAAAVLSALPLHGVGLPAGAALALQLEALAGRDVQRAAAPSTADVEAWRRAGAYAGVRQTSRRAATAPSAAAKRAKPQRYRPGALVYRNRDEDEDEDDGAAEGVEEGGEEGEGEEQESLSALLLGKQNDDGKIYGGGHGSGGSSRVVSGSSTVLPLFRPARALPVSRVTDAAVAELALRWAAEAPAVHASEPIATATTSLHGETAALEGEEERSLRVRLKRELLRALGRSRPAAASAAGPQRAALRSSPPPPPSGSHRRGSSLGGGADEDDWDAGKDYMYARAAASASSAPSTHQRHGCATNTTSSASSREGAPAARLSGARATGGRAAAVGTKRPRDLSRDEETAVTGMISSGMLARMWSEPVPPLQRRPGDISSAAGSAAVAAAAGSRRRSAEGGGGGGARPSASAAAAASQRSVTYSQEVRVSHFDPAAAATSAAASGGARRSVSALSHGAAEGRGPLRRRSAGPALGGGIPLPISALRRASTGGVPVRNLSTPTSSASRIPKPKQPG